MLQNEIDGRGRSVDPNHSAEVHTAMAEQRKESSVLFSLRELRDIEDQRIQEEEDAEKKAEEERIRAQMEAERQAREAEENARLAKESEERSRRDAAERSAREEQMRLEEAERRARVEAQAALERERLAKEMEIRAVEAQKKRPVALVVTMLILLVIAGGFGVFAYKRKQQSDKTKREAAELEQKVREDIDKTLAKIDSLNEEKEARFQKLLAAKTEEEKIEAQRQLEETERKLKAQREALKALRERTRIRQAKEAERERKRAHERKKVKVKCPPSDPLCGI